MLELESVNLSFENFHRAVLDRIHATILPGDFVILIGGNGSGKSSLLKLLNGLYKPSAGHILFEKKPLHHTSLEQISRNVCTLTQDLTLSTFSDLTVLENCQLASLRHQKHLPELSQLVEFLDHFHPDLKNQLHTHTRKLSGGQRQTLALAMALLYPPKLLLLDEHTSALDPKTAHNVMEITAKVIAEHKVTTIMITHELSDALHFGNRLLALKEGKLVFEAYEERKKILTKEDLLHLCY